MAKRLLKYGEVENISLNIGIPTWQYLRYLRMTRPAFSMRQFIEEMIIEKMNSDKNWEADRDKYTELIKQDTL